MAVLWADLVSSLLFAWQFSRVIIQAFLTELLFGGGHFPIFSTLLFF